MKNYKDFGKRKQIQRENETILSVGKKFEVYTSFVIIHRLN